MRRTYHRTRRIPVVNVVGVVAAAAADAVGAAGIEVETFRVMNAGAEIDVGMAPGVERK